MVRTSRLLELVTRPWRSAAPDALALAGAAEPTPEVAERSRTTKGFLAPEEGLALFRLALVGSTLGPCVEIGSYCGKSTLMLGDGCRTAGSHPTFTVDHHRGSAEQQIAQQYFDPELYDFAARRPRTLEMLVLNIRDLGLEEWIIPIVGDSAVVGRNWGRALGLVFIDGSHAKEDIESDVESWSGFVARDGYICFHDLYEDPAEGGQAPLEVFEELKEESCWEYQGQVGTLGILRRR